MKTMSGTIMVLVIKVLQEVYCHSRDSRSVDQQVLRYFFHCGHCPQCGKKTDFLTAVRHEGFCGEKHHVAFIQKHGHITCSYATQVALAEYEENHRDPDLAEIVSCIFEQITQGATFADVANTRIPIPQEYVITRGPEQIVAVTPFVINHYLQEAA